MERAERGRTVDRRSLGSREREEGGRRGEAEGEGAALWQPSTALPSRNHTVFIRFDSKLGQNESCVLCAVSLKRVCKCE